MIKRLISFFLTLVFLIAVPLSAAYRYNPYTRKLDFYEAAGDITLGDIGDITLTGLATGNVLYYNGTAWVNLATGANTEVLTLAGGVPTWAAGGAPAAHAASHEVAGADLVDHDQLTNYLAAQHLTLPNTIVAVLTDHNKAAHDALLIDADTVDGEHAAAIVTNARVKAHFPDTIVNILSDHNLAAHPATIGGTGLGVYVIGDILYASGVGTLARLADVAVGSALISGGVGVAPTWSTDLATGMTIGTAYIYRVGGTDVAVADGGTGLGSYTTGDIIYASGAGTLAGLADVAVGQALMSGGVGVAPAWDASPSFTGLVSSVGLTTTSQINISTTDLDGIVFGSLGTANYGIDLSGSGLVGAADYWLYNSATDYWRSDGRMFTYIVNATGSLQADVYQAENATVMFQMGADNSIIASLFHNKTWLMGNRTAVGALVNCTSNTTATIALAAAWGFLPVAGDFCHLTDATTAADEGYYRVVSVIANTSFDVDRALTGADADVDVTFYKDVIGFFATDGVNGQRIMNYSHQDKPLQIGGDVLVATGHGLGSEDVLIGGLLEVDGAAYLDAGLTVANLLSFPATRNIVLGDAEPAGFAGAIGNILFGLDAGTSTTGGDYAVSIGEEAGYYNQTGIGSIKIGYQAGKSAVNKSDSYNVIIGWKAAGFAALEGGYNIVLGYEAGFQLSTGLSNILMGQKAGYDIKTTDYNIFIGTQAGQNCVGIGNVGIGLDSSYGGAGTWNSNYNISIGYSPLHDIIDGANGNIAIGHSANYYNEAGDFNVTIGDYAGMGIDGEEYNYNILIGGWAGKVITTASSNVMVGYLSGSAATSGGDHVLVGENTGKSLTTETGNVMIGHDAGENATASNVLYIANSNTATPLVYGDFTDGDLISANLVHNSDHKVTGYNRYDTVYWNDCFDHGTVASKYQFDWDIASLNTQGNGSNTVDTTPSEITLTTDNNAIGDNEGTRTEFAVIQRARQNRTEWSLDLKQTANTQFYMGWNTSGTNAMVAAADEYVIVFFDVSDNANWQIKVGDGATEDVFTSAIAGAVAHIIHEVWVETDGTVHWAVNGTELDITGPVDNLMTASNHYLIAGQAQSVTGAAVIVVEIDYVENEKTKAH